MPNDITPADRKRHRFVPPPGPSPRKMHAQAVRRRKRLVSCYCCQDTFRRSQAVGVLANVRGELHCVGRICEECRAKMERAIA